MSWQKTKISEFLIERKDRFKPDKANELGLPRIEKIDFSGTIYINNFKPTKTGMILVKNGDLVISGINVEKGALAIYKGDTDALATIHYSSYTYDEDRIDIDFLKWYLQSNIFRNILKGQVKGGIKTEIKPKTFLNLEIILPDLTTQNQITSKLNQLEENIKGWREELDTVWKGKETDAAEVERRNLRNLIKDAEREINKLKGIKN